MSSIGRTAAQGTRSPKHNFSWITGCNVTGSGFGDLLARLKKLDRLPWHHCRNFLFVHELRMRVPLQYDAEIIEPSNDPLQPNTIYQKDGDRRVVFEDMIQKHVLNVLRLFWSHEYPRSLFGAEPAQFVPTVSSARTKPPRCRSEDGRALAIHKATSGSINQPKRWPLAALLRQHGFQRVRAAERILHSRRCRCAAGACFGYKCKCGARRSLPGASARRFMPPPTPGN